MADQTRKRFEAARQAPLSPQKALPKVLLLSVQHPELVRGGAQQICYELFLGLRASGKVRPILLAAVDPEAAALYKSGARITGFDGREDEFLFLDAGFDHRWMRLPSADRAAAYAEFLELMQPDVVHFHHFMLFGVDFLTLTRKVLPRARIILTLHEFLSICAANGQMVRPTDGAVCTRPSPVRCHQCFPDRGPEFFFMREMWVKRHFEAVDLFTTPSRFMIDQFVQWGLNPDKLVHVTNGQQDYGAGWLRPPGNGPRNRFGFFGQLVDNKGVHVILEAVQILRAEGFTGFTVEINGGNLRFAGKARRAEIESFREAEEALAPAERIVRFNGAYEVERLPELMNRIDWCLAPSVWREAFGLVISEAWMFRKPVICSQIGAMAERVADGVNGLFFALGDPRSLADVIRRACTEKGLWESIVATIEPPPSREVMVEAFLALYAGRSGGEAQSDTEAAPVRRSA
ncbi:MAG TPA: glycosyltransferase family 4 protein [Caulobacteraceae bacterium]|nr:glycosyltransferase family 4 protein [Caulobacteraceae bacterium]